MFVREWMSSPALYVPSELPVRIALGFFEAHDLHCAPVIERGRLVGMVAKDALVGALRSTAWNRRGEDAPVVDVMRRGVAPVAPDDRLEHAAHLMVRRRVDGLPVVEDDRLVGILTR